MNERLAILAALFGLGCSSGSGALVVTVSGEQAAAEGWPFVADGVTVAHVDGWSIDVDRALVAVADLTLESADGESVALGLEPSIVALHGGTIEIGRFDAIPARRWDRVGYRMPIATAGMRLVGGATEAEAAAMTAEGLSFLLDGTAHHPGRADVALHIGVPFAVALHHCQSGDDGTDGVVIAAGGATTGELTFHLDHFFLESLVSEEPVMRFEAWAAAAGSDGVVTIDDLATQSLSDLRDTTGMPLMNEAGEPVIYDPGAARLPRADLREYVLEGAATLGHWQGEGHCEYQRE